MLNLKDALAHNIQEGLHAAQKAGNLPKLKKDIPVVVEHTENSEYGDYASPIGLMLAKAMKKSPMDIVTALVATMPKKEYIGKVEVAEPGFLNIRINPGWMTARLNNVVEQDVCSDTALGQGKSVNLEFISANPNGPLTLANARSAFSADALGNVLGCVGYNVTREYYINDAGAQVKRLGQSLLRRALQAQGKQVEFPEDLYQGDYIKDVALRIAEEWKENEGKEFTEADLTDDELVGKISEQGVQIFLNQIKQTVQEDLKITFDVWTSEKHLRGSGVIEKTLELLKKRDEIYTKDGATWFRTSKYGDEQDRVLIKKDGEYAYIVPDIAYHQSKYERGFDLIFTFVGADHQGHLPKLKASMQALGLDVSKLHLVTVQWFRLMQNGEVVKVSKRAGNIITPKDLIQDVGYDAARFFLLQHKLNTPMDFDLDLARERSERNPVYYVQYAYVRLQSILRRAKEQGLLGEVEEHLPLTNHPTLTHTYEIKLMRELYRFPEVVDDIARTFSVHTLAYYATELAQNIHAFYRNVPVLTADEKMVPSRLHLVLAARAVMGKTLDLLGVTRLNVM